MTRSDMAHLGALRCSNTGLPCASGSKASRIPGARNRGPRQTNVNVVRPAWSKMEARTCGGLLTRLLGVGGVHVRCGGCRATHSFLLCIGARCLFVLAPL